jgi:MFS family permease
MVLSGPIAGRLSDRYGLRRLMIGSSLTAAATLFLFSLFDASTGLPFMIAALPACGFAIGVFMPPDISLIPGSGRQEEGGSPPGS